MEPVTVIELPCGTVLGVIAGHVTLSQIAEVTSRWEGVRLHPTTLYQDDKALVHDPELGD